MPRLPVSTASETLGRRQAGDDGIDLFGNGLRIIGPFGAIGDQAFGILLVQIVDGDVKSLPEQASGQMLSQMSETNEPVFHAFSRP